jgi:precorrin-6B methylase 2
MTKKWTVDEILGTARAFQPGCVITAAAELDVFTALRNGPMTAAALAAELGADPRATTILLDALTSLEILTKQAPGPAGDNNYSVAADAAELLSETSPKNVLPMVRHIGVYLRRWAQLAKVVRLGEPAERTPGILGEAGETAAFIGAMDNISRPIAAEVVGRLQPLNFTHLLDVGGASGTWTIAFLKIAPRAKATIFDLPDVIPMAKKRIAEAGLTDRVRFVAGDFYENDLPAGAWAGQPAGADLAWLGAIAHQNSREQNRALFAKVHAALRKNGTIVIRDVVMEPSHTAPAAGALFAVNMLVGTSAGGTYSFDEYTEDLTAAGFADVALVHRDEAMNSLIRARKP